MIYLDNAATSFPKPDAVCEKMLNCMKWYCANPGRGSYGMSVHCGLEIIKVREKLAQLFNIKDHMNICFTKNATEAINMGIYGKAKIGDHIITTTMEHNSVARPLKHLQASGVCSLTLIKADKEGLIDVSALKKAIRKNTSMIVMTLSSNVNGAVMPVAETGEITRKLGITFMLDASQGAGSENVDTDKMNIDILAFPGHKGLLGPQGTGGIYVREGIRIKPLVRGGTGSNSQSMEQPDFMPDRLESGTLNTPGILGLGEGLAYILSMGSDRESALKRIKDKKWSMIEKLAEGLGSIEGIQIRSPLCKEKNSGIIAVQCNNIAFKEKFVDNIRNDNIRSDNIGIDSAEIGNILDKKYGIAVRCGFHCSALAHETLGTGECGLVRFSPGIFNTEKEIDTVIYAVRCLFRGGVPHKFS